MNEKLIEKETIKDRVLHYMSNPVIFDEGIVFDRAGLRNVFVWGVRGTIQYVVEWKPEYYYIMTNISFGAPKLAREREIINPAFSNTSYWDLRRAFEPISSEANGIHDASLHSRLLEIIRTKGENPDIQNHSKLVDPYTSSTSTNNRKTSGPSFKVKDAKYRREKIAIFFERPVQFEEGIVFEEILQYVYVWGVNDEIRCDREYPEKYSSLKESKSERKHFNSYVDRAFRDLKYSELRWLFKSKRFGGEVKSKYEKDKDIEKHLGLVRKIKEYGDLPDLYNPTTQMTIFQKAFRTDEECKPKEYKSAIEALRDLGGAGSLWDICKVFYGDRKISTNESISIKKELDAAESVEIDDNYVFHIIEDTARSEKSDKTIGIPERKPETKNKSHAVISPKERILVVKMNLFDCRSKYHSTESLLVDIPVMKNGSIYNETAEIQHCITEDKFFIFDTDFYLHVYKYGKINSNNVLRPFILNGKNWGLRYSPMASFSPESPLMIAGYNVSQKNDLSESKRHQILDNIIDLGVLSLQDVKNYLSTFASTLGAKPENWLAKEKWEDDLQYLQQKYKGKHIGVWTGKIKYRDKVFNSIE